MQFQNDDVIFNILVQCDIVTILKCELVQKSFHNALRSQILWLHLCIRHRVHQRPKIPIDFTQKYFGDEGYDPFEEKVELLAEENTSIVLEFGKDYWWRKHFWTYYCVHLRLSLHPDFFVPQGVFQHIRAISQALPNSRCHGCRNPVPLLCLQKDCYTYGCGRSVQEHALTHYRDTRHPVIVDSRSLDLWCYKCDRYLDGENEEEIRALRTIQLLNEDLYPHRQLKNKYCHASECKICLGACPYSFHEKCAIEDDLRRKKL